MESKDLTILDASERENAKESGVGRLKMAVWYDPELPEDRQLGEALIKTFELMGCNVRDQKGNLRSPDGLLAGSDVSYATTKMFREADVVHIVLSNKAIRSRGRLFIPGLRGASEASKEMLPGNIFIIPIKLDQDSMPAMFKDIQPINFYEDDLDKTGQKLLRTWQMAAKQSGY